jgi:hypothetical protein
MTAVFSDPGRLVNLWRSARAVVDDPETARRREIDAELGRRGFFRRMVAAAAVARSRTFRDALEARYEDRAAAKSEDDLARVCESVLRELGADMTDLHVRLRRRTEAELRKDGFIGGQVAQLRMRICPTIEAAREVVAAVDAQLEADEVVESSGELASALAGEQAGQGASLT